MTLSKGQIIGIVVVTAAIAVGIGFLIWYIEKNKSTPQTPAPNQSSAPVQAANLALTGPSISNLVDPNANSYATRTPDLATSSGAHLYDASNPAPSDPQPVESDYSAGSGVG